MFEKRFKSKTTAAQDSTLPVSARRLLTGSAVDKRQASSEVATLVYAVSVAVALGIACGAWINARLASAASVTPPAPTRLLPVANAEGRQTAETSNVTEPRPAEPHDTSATPDQPVLSQGYSKPFETETVRTNPAGATDRAREGKRGVVSAMVLGEAGRTAREAGLPAATPDVAKRATAAQGRSTPCGLYASAGSLSIRNGGAAALIVGGPGEAGRVNVTTPDWADIAVFSEGRAGGNGWVRYSVRSVSKRAGVFTVRFTTPCGSQTIPVTVTRP